MKRLMIIIFSFIGAILAGLFGRQLEGSAYITTSSLFFSFLLSLFEFCEVVLSAGFVHIKLATCINSEVLNIDWVFMLNIFQGMYFFRHSFFSKWFGVKHFSSGSKDLDLEAFLNQNQNSREVELLKMSVRNLKILCKEFKIRKYASFRKKKLVRVIKNRLLTFKAIIQIPSIFPEPGLKPRYLFIFVNAQGQIDATYFFSRNKSLNVWLNSTRYKDFLSIYCRTTGKNPEETITRFDGRIYLDKKLACFTALEQDAGLHFKLTELSLVFGESFPES